MTNKTNKLNHNLNTLNISKVPLSHKNFITIKADSGPTKHYFCPQDTDCITDI